jgi:hypothetical protein
MEVYMSESDAAGYEKVYVKVIAEFLPDGRLTPLCLFWDERRIEIDRVLDARPAPSLKAGGQGMRYYCKIYGQPRYIWLEEGRWFVEARKDA